MPIKIAQYGTKHGHAAGKARAILTNPETALAGIFEADPAARDVAASHRDYAGVRWYRSAEEMLGDPEVVAVAIEGRNDESLAQAQEAAEAGKHLWYDKPAGDDWPAYERFYETVQARKVYLQMGYMFRYNEGFRLVGDWARSGFLGDVFSVRAHMSTNIPTRAASPISSNSREIIADHRGGIFYDLAGHMLDQVVWILGRPTSARLVARNDATRDVPTFADNSLGVFEFERALAFVDISAMEATPPPRRFEVYGTRGSAVLEPFEPEPTLRLWLDEPRGGFTAGVQTVPLEPQPRQVQYERELAAFLRVLRGERTPDRPLAHERLVQESLLRATAGTW
jgi:predicted dehydrogenase